MFKSREFVSANMRTFVSMAAISLGVSFCGGSGSRDQAYVAMAEQQQKIQDSKDAAQRENSFAQVQGGCEAGYGTMKTTLDLNESQYMDWLNGTTARQKETNEFIAVTKVHDELKTRIDSIEAEHAELMKWYERVKENPSTDDIMRLSQSYTSMSQKQQLCVVSFAQINARTAAISSAK